MLRWLVLAVILGVSTVHAAPRVMPFLPTPGIRLPGNAIGGAFCTRSQRAILRLDKNTLVSIDASRTLREVATLPPGLPLAPMMCDPAKDRIYIGANRQLVTIENGQVTTEKTTFELRDMRALADGTLLLLDAAGNVSRWDGTTATPLWSMGRVAIPMSTLDTTGEKVLSTLGGRIEVATKSGKKLVGPNALVATWLDDKTVLFSWRSGLVARWAIDAPATDWYKVDEVPARRSFVRTMLYRAGKRFIAERIDGVIRTISIDNKGIASSSSITRVPLGRRTVAAGDAPFAVIAVNDRAFVVDVTRPSQAIDISLPGGAVEALAFSPDGRELAMLAGQDIVVASVDRTAFRKLVIPTFTRGPLLWAADGTLLVMNNAVHVRFNPDGTTDQRKVRTVGFTPAGNPITVTRDQRIIVDRGHSEQVFKIPERSFSILKIEVTDRLVMMRSARRIDIYALDAPDGMPPIRRTRESNFMRDGALLGENSILFVDDTNSLFLADDAGEHALGKLQGFPILAVSRDRKRVALATQETVAVYDDHGRSIETFTVTVGPIRALAWSPNLHTLAVAGRDGVELWTIPR